MKIFQLIDLIIRIFRLNKRAKAIALFLIPFAGSCQGGGFYFAGEPYLLDAYPGASAAYSVHKLRRDYTGNAMQIRRASDNGTANIGFIDDNLDTPAISSHCAGTDCFVITWYDQSGNGNNATQSTAANQPKIYDSITGLVTENGKPAIDFDGSNNFLENSGFGVSGNDSRSYFIAAITDTVPLPPNPDAILSQSDGTTIPNGQHWIITSEISVRVYGGNITFDQSSIGSALISNFYNGSNVSDARMFKNANNLSVSASNSKAINTSDQVNFIGKQLLPTSSLFNGRIQLITIYPSDQTANRVGIETSINNYFSIY